MAAKFEISKDHAGKFRFHLKAPNGEIIAASQGYESKASAKKPPTQSIRMRLPPLISDTRPSGEGKRYFSCRLRFLLPHTISRTN